MALRKIVKIDEEKCDGCGVCVPSCAEGAIKIIDGKAKLAADNLCDGLGACLGECPMDAITIEEREADEFDEAAVEEHLKKKETPKISASLKAETHLKVHAGGGCPGARIMSFSSSQKNVSSSDSSGESQTTAIQTSELRQWPVQLHLTPPTAPFFQKADVLLAADCAAFSAGDFHSTFLKGKALAIACPKLDDGQDSYLQKLTAMIDQAQINTLSVLIMEVPCCGGLIRLAKEAASRASRKIPIKRIVLSLKGTVVSEEWV